MIKTFDCKETQRLYHGEKSRKFPLDIQKTALRRLQVLNGANTATDLAMTPGNRLEKLKGNRDGQYSIRINDKWRVCFRFEAGDAYDVEICDYH
jgi:proteic killer suppression protein